MSSSRKTPTPESSRRPPAPPAGRAAAALAVAALTAAAVVAVIVVLLQPGHGARIRPGRLFAPSSVWNRAVPANAPLDPKSATYVAELTQQVARYGAWFNTTQYSVPVYTVGRSRPTVPVGLDPAAGSQPALAQAWRSVPMPAHAEPATGSDGALVIWQPSTDKMWEFWQLQRDGGGWHARWGGYMSSVSHNPGYYEGHTNWGASATSLPAAAGLVRISELKAGHIDHALSLGLPEVSSLVYSWPAERTDGTVASPDAIPEGTHFRLAPSLDISKLNLPPFTRMLAEAAQRYGLIVHDRGPEVLMWGEDPSHYPTDPYLGPNGFFHGEPITTLMERFPWAHLQALRTIPHQVAP